MLGALTVMTSSRLAHAAGGADEGCDLALLFEGLTFKQHEVFEMVSDNRTSKEIAARLGITESAVNQRIESVRLRAGSLPRAHLARCYREFRSTRSVDWLRGAPLTHEAEPLHPHGSERAMAKSADVDMPSATSGLNRPLHRMLMILMIAATLMILAVGGLVVAHMLIKLQ